MFCPSQPERIPTVQPTNTKMQKFTLLLTLLTPFALSQNSCTGDKSIIGHCTITSFTDLTTTSPNPPTTAECQDTCRGVLGDAGDWIVDFRNQPDGYKQTMLLYPCSFGVGRGAGEPRNYFFYMHNQDIVDVLDEVNQRFGPLHGGRVAAQGTMVCDGRQATWYIN
ncbi:hypothetical protein B0J11DRAFT_539472 [Dendryphion nanum]|uniref:Ecp2 effector protein-like domain-containing protein n=1 Tax=Dendryphion nanum TaxID=256645 RepID=A0A9P9IC87_9PLEO|nr:hypothetical protein B0J11DRAFT_539472 [Dendryphion nanum]